MSRRDWRIFAGAVLAGLSTPALAQDGARVGGPGGGPGAEPPGAYASPSAIPADPATLDLGIPDARGLKRLEPIELPRNTEGDLPPNASLPRLPALLPQPETAPGLVRPLEALVLKARLGKDGPEIPDHLVWRLFSPKAGPDGKLPAIAVAKGGEAVFDVPAGSYLLHVGFGRAGMTQRIDFNGRLTHQTVTIEAGGLRLHATSSEDHVITDKLTFDIYSQATDDQDRQLIASDVEPDVVVRLNAGDYHVVSHFGDVNAVVRADIRVEAGKVTDATLAHHAAELTLKLVRERGGEALADTAWSITSDQGDMIRESVGAFASMVLQEGDYIIVARNKDRIFQRPFQVTAGEKTEVEVLTSDLIDPNSPEAGTGD